MGKETRTRIYIASVLVAAATVVGSAVRVWHAEWDASNVLLMLLIAGLVFLAARFPFKLSPQAEASLYTVPLFMGALTLHPAYAVISGVAGLAVSELSQRRPAKVVTFNVAVTAFMVCVSGMVFWALRPSGADFSLTSPYTITAVMAAGLTLHFTNLLLMAGMVTIRKGSGFWSYWKETWGIDVVQEGGAFVLGFGGALLAEEALWTVTLLVVPAALAYAGFRRSVEETSRSVEFAEHNANLAAQLEERLHELEETQTQLIMKSEKLASVGVTAAGVVHEVKNAMCVTAGRSELLMRNADLYFKSERAIEHVRNIHEMTGRVTKIVQELLAYSRTDTSFVPTRLTDAMDVAADLVGKNAAMQGVNIEKDYEEAPEISGISNQLQQVFVNLLMNSIDASPSGGTITLRCGAEDGYVVASIKDTGTGIPTDVLDRMFEPFYTTKEIGKGTGLGMFVCNKIVTDHEGEISVRSEEGVGTETIIRIPAIVIEELDGSNGLGKAKADIDQAIAAAIPPR